ncbi:hypothetical protein EV702DRAFT_1204452 [Suillus placidus]|uniref:Uncharacterized protein n=1 Tax=Suillus placidus TaxID=48579 RepID=A0A9P6ZGZ8_9AGAM|nr:hypothetical protein EV702DRAFT_1204452 [Suillus placidus]
MLNANPPSKSLQPEIVASEKAREEPMSILASRQHLDSSATNPPQSGAQSPERELTREQRRKKKLALRSAALKARCQSDGHEVVAPQTETVASRAPSSPPTDVGSPPQGPSNDRTGSGPEQTNSSSSNGATPVSVNTSSPPPANSPARHHGPLAMPPLA